ncbi:MAG TPA: methyltransferase domain-containing protein [Candidatus Angelobacter sp.]|nr:methyltransferase domain-containing protein [Candidatus Angelobacter sp.]
MNTVTQRPSSIPDVLTQENLWGYKNRLEFVDEQCLSRFSHRNVSVLDVGCGNGSYLAIPLSLRGYDVTGVDPHQKSITRAVSFGSDVEFFCGACAEIRAKFNVVILSEVLEHLHHPEALLADAVKRMAPGGLMIVTVPNGYGEFEIDSRIYYGLHLDRAKNSFYALRRRLVGKLPPVPDLAATDDTSGHVQRFTLARIRNLFAAHGLVIACTRGTSFISGPIVCSTIAHIPGFMRWNVAISKGLPLILSSGWMFSLTVSHTGNPDDARRANR